MPPGDRKSRNVKKRYTWVKKDFDNEAESFENDFPLPPAEPLSAQEYFDMFVSRSMLKAVVDESNRYYFQKHGTALNLTVEELTSVLGMFFRMGLVNMHRIEAMLTQDVTEEELCILNEHLKHLHTDLRATDSNIVPLLSTTEAQAELDWVVDCND
ncbi:hypothetical protein HPB52_006094 [Rhipicephalus sanguineus]|uniref:PiggyBac transposable element-derived protein domain-containing protein n=1 Tax=Rhipicephalus sanguineus TaxID=34632 RepID=A0A9D4PYN0_RHISA|nr:hypothetical protein HPB52_006094 [Rhipicephalus sanguineus]